MHPDVQRAFDDISSAIEGMNAPALERHPEGKWSTAQILEHLLLSFRTSGRRLEKALQERRTLAEPDTFGQRFGAFVVVGLGYFPTGRPAPEYVTPKGLPAGEVLDAVKAALAEFDALAARCADAFGEDVKVSNHPILGAFSIRQWRRFHRVHTRHHMKQVAKLRADDRGQAVGGSQ
jgi:hypothetical protein